METINMKKYIMNKSSKVIPYNKDCVYIKSCFMTYSLKGANVSLLLNDIINEFQVSREMDEVIAYLANKYTKSSIESMIDFLLQKKFLIEDYNFDQESKLIDTINLLAYLNKTPDEIIQNINKCKLGLIVSDSLIKDIIYQVDEVGWFKNLYIVDLDNENIANITGNDKLKINMIKHSINSLDMLEEVVKDSNFVIVALDRYNDLILENVNYLCIKYHINWIKTIIDGVTGEIGPLVIPGITPCYECYRIRSINNRNGENLIVFKDDIANKDNSNFGYLIPSNNINISFTLLETVKSILGVGSMLEGKILYANYLTLDFSIHNIVKVSNCPSCS